MVNRISLIQMKKRFRAWNFFIKEINECIIELNGIITSPCLNNGVCYDLIDGFFCELISFVVDYYTQHYLIEKYFDNLDA